MLRAFLPWPIDSDHRRCVRNRPRLALALAADQPRLALVARTAAKLEAVADECRQLGAETLVVPADVTRDEQCRAAVAQTVERFGQLSTCW